MLRKSKSLVLIIGILIILSLSGMTTSAQIIETNGVTDNGYYQPTIVNEVWQLEYESAFTDGLGHKQYEVLYQNGYRTTTTRYTGTYIVLGGENVNNNNYVNNNINVNNNKGEWRFINNVEKPYFVNSVTNEIFYIVTTSPVQTYDPYGPYSPYDPGNSNNNNSNSTDMYLNINNTPKTTGLSGCEAYYLNTGNRTVKVHVTVPSGWRLIIGGVQVENKSNGVYTYFTSTCTKTVKNGFAILVPSDSLYSEFKARVQLARDNNWDCRYITWPQVSIN